jgi:hypothetical protein
METKIFELIVNSGGLALVLAILFYYSLTSFRYNKVERNELRKELKERKQTVLPVLIINS